MIPTRNKLLYTVVLCIALMFSLPAMMMRAQAPSPDPAVKTTAELLQQGDRSAREGNFIEALDAWKRAFERRFAGFREVAFSHHVEAEYLNREALREKILEEFRKEMPDELLQAQEKALVCFGFVESDFHLKEVLLEILTSEIAGFYDPDTKRLYLIREGDPAAKRRWWEKLLGSGFDPEEQKMVLVHEMSHALMDQYHDLLSLHRSVEHDDDMSLALHSLVEGEAMLSMMVGAVGEGDKSLLRSTPGFWNFYLNLLKPLLSFAGGPGFGKAPPIIQETLLFPYFRGLTFCLSQSSADGTWKPIDACFSEPPTSTEQILHPEKYPQDLPTSLSFPDLTGVLGPGWSEVYSNVLGELQVQILLAGKLSKSESVEAAAGWDGDFFRIYRRPPEEEKEVSQEILLVWASTWDSPGDAREFSSAFIRHLSKRFGEEPKEDTKLRIPEKVQAWTWNVKGRISAVLVRGVDAWILDGIPEGSFSKVVESATKMERAPKVFQLRRVKPAVEFSEDRRTRARRF